MKIVSAVYIACTLLSAQIDITKAEEEIYEPSLALTPEEEALFTELSDLSSSVGRLIHQPLNDVITITQDRLTGLEGIEETISNHADERESMASIEEDLENQTQSIVEAIESLNSKQILKLVNRLQASLEEELLRREKLSQMLEKEAMKDNSSSNAAADDDDDDDDYDYDGDEDEDEDGEGAAKYTVEDLEEEIDFDIMAKGPAQGLQLQITELAVKKWHQKLADYSAKCDEILTAKENELYKKEEELSKTSNTGEKEKKRSTTCANLQQAVNAVNIAIWKLGHEEADDVLRHASVVYGSDWTSDTYQLGIRGSTDDASSSDLTLGDARIRQYIPEDWERLLPSGWQDWDISVLEQLVSTPSPQTILPSYVWHSMPPNLANFLESPFQKAVPAPAEAILNPNSNLGSCWRMPGRNGRVTLRLEHPTVVKNITISHYPWLPSAHNPKEYMRHVSSAPRYMQIIGYPACKSIENGYPSLAEEEEHEYCVTNLGFDGDSPMKYGSFEYKIDLSGLVDEEDMEDDIPTSSIQTFSVSLEAQTGEGDDDDDDEDDEGLGMGGCSAIKPTCDGAPTEDIAVQAITLVVDENWGHSDYTCIYRIQIGGEDA